MDYQKQAEDFLTRHGMTFKATLIGSDCPRFCEDAQKMQKMNEINQFPRKSHIHGKHYRCEISHPERGPVFFDFWNSYADEEHNTMVALFPRSIPKWTVDIMSQQKRDFAKRFAGKKRKNVTAYDLLACIEKYDVGTFEDFCSEFGYDSDSRRAFETYTAVQEEVRKVQRFFTAEELEELQEIN